MFEFVQISFRATILLVSISVYFVLDSQAFHEPVVQPGSLSTPLDLQRLRNMFFESNKQALDGIYENKLLSLVSKTMRKNVTTNDREESTAREPPLTSNVTSSSDKNTQTSNDEKTSKWKSSNETNEDDVPAEVLEKVRHDDLNIKNDARQSLAGWSPNGLGSPNMFGQSNQLFGVRRPMSLPSMPSLSTIPMLPSITQLTPFSPPRPKTSVIGNNGGHMALTNDNVVVVNVLSSNF